MESSENKRATKGTEHTLKDALIGGEFKREKNAAFIEERAKLWDEFAKENEEKQKALPHEKITVKFHGKDIEGISNETTPYMIGEKHMKKSELKEVLVAKVSYLNKLTIQTITSTEEESQETHGAGESKDASELWDLHRPLVGDCELEFCSFESKEGRTVFWHSSAHALGSAIETIFGAKLCIGPALEEGFFYDSYMGKEVVEQNTDFKVIEEEVKKQTKENSPFSRLVLTKKQALDLFKANPFKVQLLTTKVKDDEFTTAYRCGKFIDLCLGPHIPNMNLIKSLKITKNSGTNWLGKVTNDPLQRVYGISFPSEKLMKEYIARKEEEEKRDHRNIGKQQGLFMFHNLSPGSCFWYQAGSHVYNKLIEFIRKQYVVRGYQEVISPNIYNLKLWKTSGHYKNYKENLFLMKVEDQGFGLKPMNCPGHCLMFDNVTRSYKELPIRMADFGVLHRNEISGALTGLTRVRRFQQDDAHIFCRYDQIMDEVLGFLDFMSYVYEVFGFKYELFLSTRPAKMLGTAKLWDMAENALKEALDKFGRPWKLNPGDGAFYGPKIDILLYDALGRQHQCGTVQLDFQLPIRFNLMYRTEEQVQKEKKPEDTNVEEGGEGKKKKKKKKKGEKEEETEGTKEEKGDKIEEGKTEGINKEVYPADEWDNEVFNWEEKPLKSGYARPCIVHRAILGSVERCSAILIEHFAGKYPFWLSPRQLILCTISDEFKGFAEKMYLNLKLKGYQVELDISSATLQKKVRNAQLSLYNFIGVIGAEEVKGNSVDIRTRDGERIGKFTVEKLVEYFKTLEPKPSKKEVEMINKINEGVTKDEMDINEEKLKYELYLTGDYEKEEDKEFYKKIEKITIDKEKYPNIYKWKKIMDSFEGEEIK